MVLATFLLITRVSIGVKNQQLEYLSSIKYLVKFKKDHTEVLALINFGNEVNTITPAYAAVSGLYIYLTDVRAQKFDRSTPLTYSMVLANFQLEDK